MLRVNALGGLAVVHDGVRLEGAAGQPRRLALLALLAMAGPRGLGRDKILALLWPDADEDRARKNLAQSVYALRQVMGEEAMVVGTWDLRLNSDRVGSDLADFDTARQSGALDQAAVVYGGPFLDGFHLAGAPEFERWVDEQRSALNHVYADLLERLAVQAREQNNARAGVLWWRKRAALDPHDGRVAAALMRALIAAGDTSGALQHGRSFQTALVDELELPPDREVESVNAGLLSGQIVAAPSAPAPPMPSGAPAVAPAPVSVHPVGPVAVPHRVPWALLIGSAAVGLVLLGVGIRWAGAGRDPPTLSIGRLADYRTLPREELRGPLVDLLATALGRSPALRVVSTARMYELLGGPVSESDLPISTWAEVARRAGASQLIDGALYQLPDGLLRLDLRRLDLRNGEVLGSARAQAADPFALADSATAVLLAGMGFEAPRGSIAALTTSSIAAYRLYEQGLQALFRLDRATARSLFEQALREDSTFAMAALYAAKANRDWGELLVLIQHAHRLADRASERERFLIRAQAAIMLSDPALNGYIDSLVTRFPGEIEGYLFAGIARIGVGEFLGALPYLERVVEMDSASLAPAGGECRACDALFQMVGAYQAMDSLAAAERMARRMTRLVPQWPNGWRTQWEVLSILGKYDEAQEAAIAFDQLWPTLNFAMLSRAQFLIRGGRGSEAASLLAEEAANSAGERRAEALWFQAIALREAGRLEEAVEIARRYRRETVPISEGLGVATSSPMLLGMALEQAGQGRAAAALFDSIAAHVFPSSNRSHAARTRAWVLTQAATALAAAGDTSRLAGLADSIRDIGAGSSFVRDWRLHRHVRGLLLAARGQDSLALDEFHASFFSLTMGYTRTNVEAARLHLKRGEARQAVALLEPALGGSLEASNLYVARRTIHTLLVQAWTMLGDRERAAEHRRLAAGN